MMKYALYDYIPMRYSKYLSFRQRDLNRRILDFKDGRCYATRWAARQMAYCLQALSLQDVTIVCIPASSEYSHVRRYRRFCTELCALCNAINGFDLVKVGASRDKKHLSAERDSISCVRNASIDGSICGRKVIVVDDICTTCASANEFIVALRAAGADVVMAMFLAKTKWL